MGPLIDVSALRALLAAPAGAAASVRVLDCGFDLFDTQAGERAYAAGHLPGAFYAHLDRDLSAAKSARGPVDGGRHPLPTRAQWAQRLAQWGITPDTPVVAYDDQGGCYAARAWWMLRWMGHRSVAVLDGGKAAWVADGGALDVTVPTAAGVADYPDQAPGMATVTADELLQRLGRVSLVDARAGERYRGETEPLDTRAGHIPGAVNRFFKHNLQPDGRFKPVQALREDWLPLLQSGVPVVHQCGSGVTACHNLLALAHAGLGEGVLYPGSWSEWSADPSRPVAVG
ncbi:MAG: sulfurtransferase [Betaproteobacteria bacterium]